MHVVYWREGVETLDNGISWCVRSAEFDAETCDDPLGDALKYSQELRTQRESGKLLSHITISSEIVGNVGLDGVSAPPADYNWMKRRNR